MIRTTIRYCALAALRRRTLAEMRVADSDNTPLLEALAENEAQPYIVVYTDDDTSADIMGLDLSAANRTAVLVLEIGVASAVTVPAQEEGEEPTLEFRIPASDEGMELVLDMVEWQAKQALWQNPYNPWGDILRSMVLSVRRVSSVRGAMAKDGARFAARQISYHLGNIISDPVPGEPLIDASPIRRFIDAAKADTDPETTVAITTAATFLESFLPTSTNPEWRRVQAQLGLTEQGVRGMGMGPLVRVLPDQVGALLDEEKETAIDPVWDPNLEVDP